MYVALDPGKTTGVVALDLETNAILGVHELETYTEVWNCMNDPIVTEVIYEQFVRSPNTFASLEAAEVTGIVKLWGEHPGHVIHPQGRQVKSFWTDDKIKKLGLWIPGMPHAMDAMRHLMFYLMNDLKDMTWVERLK